MVVTSKKVLYCITKSNWGGAQRYVFDLAVGAQKEGFVVIVAHGGNGEMAAHLKDAGVRTIPVPGLTRDVGGSDLAAYKELKKIFKDEKPDTVHLNSSKVGALGALAARRAGIKNIIFTAHGWAFNEARPWWQKISIWLSHYATVALAHRTIVVSQAVQRGTRWMPFVSKKITLIYNGIVEPEFLAKDEARAELIKKISPEITISTHTLLIGTLAELTWNKGLHHLIRAVGTLTRHGVDCALFIMGEGEERTFLETCIDEEKLNSSVFLFGHVPHGSRYLKALDIFALSSHTEALSYALIEAGYAGLPAVATNVGGIPEIAQNEKSALLVKPNNPHALADAIKKLAGDISLRTKLGAELQKEVRENFSLEKMVKETIKFY